jgi:hypothetical protein
LIPARLDELARRPRATRKTETKEGQGDEEETDGWQNLKLSISDFAWGQLGRVATLCSYASRGEFLIEFAKKVTPLFTDLSSVKELAVYARATDERPAFEPLESRYLKAVQLGPRKETF